LFLTPALLFYALFIVFPLVQSLVFGFFKVDILGGEPTYQFVGWDNYRAVIDDAVFWQSARNTLTWALASPFLEIPVGLLLALYLQRGTRLTKFMRVLWFMPVLLPQIVVGIIGLVYNSDGLPDPRSSASRAGCARGGAPDTALPAPIAGPPDLIASRSSCGAVVVKGISSERLDGASRRQVLAGDRAGSRSSSSDGALLHRKMKVRPDLDTRRPDGRPDGGHLHGQAGVHWNTFEKGYPSAMATMWFVIILVISVLVTRAMQKRDSLQY
jgi:multiple sugar transport system permease protein/raffinose/stachyose/melibiose transport system permease protein